MDPSKTMEMANNLASRHVSLRGFPRGGKTILTMEMMTSPKILKWVENKM